MGTSPITNPSRDLQTLFSAGAVGGLSDGTLLERFAAHRKEAAFEALVRRHGPMVWGVCRRVLRDHHDAEDAFQATFLVLARKAPSIAHRELVAHWLYGVAHQTARKARSTSARRRVRENHVPDVPEPEEPSHVPREDPTEVLDQELSRLPEKYRIPLVLCELEGKTHREAAQQLGWPIGTVSGRLSRARAMLARRLSRPGLSLSVGSIAVLLAQDAVSAGGVPAGLIGATARAASPFAARRAATAGLVSAEVAALTKGVLKTMLMSKVKFATAFLLMGLALAAGGTGLAYRTQAAEGPSPERAGESTKGQDHRPGGPQLGVPSDETPSGVRLSDLLGGDDPTPLQLELAKHLVESLMETDKEAQDKTPEELSTMIQEGMKELEAVRFETRVLEAKLQRLKRIQREREQKAPGRP